MTDEIERPQVMAKEVMDPLPGQKYVEFSKDGADGDRKSKVDSGLDIENKPGHGDRIYLSKVKHPAPEHNLHVGDRLVALNGKKVEEFSSLSSIRDEFATKNVVRMVVDPTMLH
jgi:membrane-associated protease RseP (regulator of RpoE activity)